MGRVRASVERLVCEVDCSKLLVVACNTCSVRRMVAAGDHCKVGVMARESGCQIVHLLLLCYPDNRRLGLISAEFAALQWGDCLESTVA